MNQFARSTDPQTSKNAITETSATHLEQLVLAAIRFFPNGCIGEDIERLLSHIPYRTVSPRFRPLIEKGLVLDTGEKRKASSGRSQRLMLAAEVA